MINAYRLDEPIDTSFAQAIRLGTWYPAKSKPCRECGRSNQKRISPLVIEWEPGSAVIGDFTWPGFNEDIIVTQRVRELLEDNFQGFQFGKVDVKNKIEKSVMVNSSKTPKSLSKDNPQLWDLLITSWCNVDYNVSGLAFGLECSICHRKAPSHVDKIVIKLSTWDGADFFRIHEYPRWIYCTERTMIFIKNHGLNNIAFSEFGTIQKDERD